jgi:invasion protein IalB
MVRAGSRLAVAVLCAMLAGTLPASAQAPASTLPGGASSLQETYGDWLVACAQLEAGKRCTLSQQQARQDGQRILGIELAVTPQQVVTGALVLPFGLELDAGVSLQVDDAEARPPLRFATCLPAGCIVPVALDAPMLMALRSGSALKLNVRAAGATEPLSFSISLRGFSAALDRTSELVR